jgi:class 3 adenylate cyclase
LLIHTVTHKSPVIDKYGNETGTPTTMYRVRLEPVKKQTLTDLGEMKDDKYLMFVDMVHSTVIAIAKGDKITFNGTELTVREIAEAYDERGLHHLEVALT